MPATATPPSSTTPPPTVAPAAEPTREALEIGVDRRPTGEVAPDETSLLMADLTHLGDETALAQQVATFVSLFLAHNRKSTEPNLVETLESQPNLTALNQAMTEFYGADGKPLWLTVAETNPKLARAEQILLTGVGKLLLKGQINGQLLKTLVDGGLQVEPANTHNQNVDEIGHFFPAGGRDGLSRIKIYGSAFGEGLDPAKVLYHELGHALLVHDGLLYNLADFRSGGPAPSTPGVETHLGGVTPVSSEVAMAAPPLSQAERNALFGALTNPGQHRPWETLYIAQLLDKLSKPDAASPVLRKHILEEMLAERIRLWFESDGSLGDFIRQRLMSSVAVQNQAGNPPEAAAQATQFKLVAQNLTTILGELTGTPGSAPAYLEMLNRFITAQASDLGGPLQAQLKAFLEESFHLHARFSRLRGKDNQAALLKLIEARGLNLVNYPFGDPNGDSWIGRDSRALGQINAAQIGKNKTLWQWLVETFGSLFSSS